MANKEKEKTPVYKKWWFWAIIVLVAIAGMGGANYNAANQDSEDSTKNNSESTTDIAEDGTPLKLKYAEVLDYKNNCIEYDDNLNCVYRAVIIKARISPPTNAATYTHSYYSVSEYIRQLKDINFDELQFWAVAKMNDGSESKVISFTVPKDTISKIRSEQIPDNKLGDYVTELWVHPSIR